MTKLLFKSAKRSEILSQKKYQSIHKPIQITFIKKYPFSQTSLKYITYILLSAYEVGIPKKFENVNSRSEQ